MEINKPEKRNENLKQSIIELQNKSKEDDSLKEIRRHANMVLLSVIFSLLIELSSFGDFFSDLLIIYSLSQTTHTAWLTFSLFTMLAPYYTVYTSLLNYQIEHLRN